MIDLICIEGRKGGEWAAEATLRHCIDAMPPMFFNSAILASPFPPDDPGLEWHRIEPMGLADYSRFCIEKLYHVTLADHVLVVQPDGYIVHPELWSDKWLQWDYIGAPWPDSLLVDGYRHCRVGNGGFSLRSRRLLSLCAEWTCPPGVNEDVMICQLSREHCELCGIQFAPVVVAARFSVECQCPETVSPTFGFHGASYPRISG